MTIRSSSNVKPESGPPRCRGTATAYCFDTDSGLSEAQGDGWTITISNVVDFNCHRLPIVTLP